MLENPETLDVTLQVSMGTETSDEKLDQMARQLMGEIRELVEAVELVSSGELPEGARIADAITIGALMMTILPPILPELIKFLHSWCLRAENRSVEIEIRRSKNRSVKVKISGNVSPEKLREIIDSVKGS